MLSIPGVWVWDFWVADDGHLFHLFFLYAPATPGAPDGRHRAARIGHAVSDDLRNWRLLSDPFGPGDPGAFDETALWTGSVVRADDGQWHMFYTGSRFIQAEPGHANVQSIGVAVSDDLVTWRKISTPMLRADQRWYEHLGDSAWPEEAWRDPWVFRDPHGDGWHMLITARSAVGESGQRGVIGHATSPDLRSWEIGPPLTARGSGFAHLEVAQTVQVDGRWFLLFACPESAMSEVLTRRHPDPGTWYVPIGDPTGPYDLQHAQPLTTSSLYSGRIVHDRSGQAQLLAFRNDTPFDGVITDPFPVHVDADGRLVVSSGASERLFTPPPSRPFRAHV